MPAKTLTITERRITTRYLAFLAEQEKSPATLAQYAPASVNTKLAAAKGFFSFCGWPQCLVKPLRIQKDLFCRAESELSRAEFTRLVQAAWQQGKQRLLLVLQTLCATGIRVSELQFITAEAVRLGRASVQCKGKRRLVFLPKKLRRALQKYLQTQKRTAGAVFVTKSGKPLDRCNIWREMKGLCVLAGVAAGKVFPHNLRHLFASTFYALEKDIARLADILGHSSMATTRVYMVESGAAHARLVEKMSIFVT